MGRVFGILLIVLGVWIRLEFQTKGSQGAFDGRFAGWFEPIQSVRAEPDVARSPITDQVRDHLNGVVEQYERDLERRTDRIAR